MGSVRQQAIGYTRFTLKSPWVHPCSKNLAPPAVKPYHLEYRIHPCIHANSTCTPGEDDHTGASSLPARPNSSVFLSSLTLSATSLSFREISQADSTTPLKPCLQWVRLATFHATGDTVHCLQPRTGNNHAFSALEEHFDNTTPRFLPGTPACRPS